MTGHGYTRYRQGCRCFTCRIAKHEYRLRYVGRAGVSYTDAAPSRAHLADLRSAGVGLRRIVAATGVSRSTLQRLATSTAVEIYTTTATKLLAFRPVTIAKPRRFLPALGTHRRMQALGTLGWPPARQISLAGLSPNGSTRLLAVEQVWPRTAEKIRDLYERLSMTPAPAGRFATKVRRRAHREYWFPPLAWDDDALDDPDALPCLLPPVAPVDRVLELHVQHLAAGHPVASTPAAQFEIARRMPDAKPGEIGKVAQCSARRAQYVRDQVLQGASC